MGQIGFGRWREAGVREAAVAPAADTAVGSSESWGRALVLPTCLGSLAAP